MTATGPRAGDPDAPPRRPPGTDAIPPSPCAAPAGVRRAGERVAVAIATRDRREGLLETLARLSALPERPRVVVADNGSSDGTPAAVRRAFPEVEVVELGGNLAGEARTAVARRVREPYLAFSDDDSWWDPGALARAVELLDRHPRLAVLAARVVVGEERREDPTCALMRESPVPRQADLPGPPVLGFVACGAVVRREAFLAVGGFDRRFGIGGEEEPLALDLAADGWGLAYVDQVTAVHHPSPAPDRGPRRRRAVRNRMWTTWLRHPLGDAVRRTARELRAAARDRHALLGAVDAARGLRWVLRERRPVPAPVARPLRALERAERAG